MSGAKVHPSTISKGLCETGLVWEAKKKSLVRKKPIKMGLECAGNNETDPAKIWNKGFWSDETKTERFSPN